MSSDAVLDTEQGALLNVRLGPLQILEVVVPWHKK